MKPVSSVNKQKIKEIMGMNKFSNNSNNKSHLESCSTSSNNHKSNNDVMRGLENVIHNLESSLQEKGQLFNNSNNNINIRSRYGVDNNN